MLVNDHCHSSCSHDGKFTMTEMAEAAFAAGLGSVCFTDHCDMLDGEGFPDRAPFSWQKEEAQFAAAREALGDRLELRLGVELGEATQAEAHARQILSHGHIDFVIGSIHNPINGQDYYFQTYSERAHCEQMITDYLAQMLSLARSDLYDVLGHITYPLRYMHYRDGVPVDFRGHDEQVREILRTVVAAGRGIELNTSGYLSCGGEPMPPEYMLRAYRQLGGEIVTIGSDAHSPDRMAQGIAQGMELLRAVGFRYLTLFRGRKPDFIKL